MPPNFLHYMALSLDGQEVLLQPASKAFLILYGDNMEVLKSEWRYVQHDMRCRQAVGHAILQPLTSLCQHQSHRSRIRLVTAEAPNPLDDQVCSKENARVF